MNKIEILAELNKIGVGYCSLKACEENIMGLPVAGVELWREILALPLEVIKDMYDFYRAKK